MLITTPKAVDANAYITEAEADDYLDNYRLYTSVWDAADSPTHEKVILWATGLLDRSFDFVGNVTDYYQALRWPRVGVYDDDGRYVNQDTIPNIIKQCCAILAAELVKSDRSAVPALISLGFREAKVGPLSVTVDPRLTLPLIPDFIVNWMGAYGSVRGTATVGSKVVSLSRS